MRQICKKKLFLVAIFISLIIHLIVLVEFSSTKQIFIDAKKSNFTYLNYTFKNNNQIRKKNLNKKKLVKDTGYKKLDDKNILSEKNKQLASQSKDDIKKIKNRYMQSILDKIHRSKYYPIYAKRMKMQGIVQIKFVLNSDGFLKNKIEIIKKSQYDILNDAGIQTIKSAEPFDKFPDYIKDNEIVFIVDIDYKLAI